jgi:hypothetical protein
LPISRFDAVLVEASVGFFAAGPLQSSVRLGAAVNKPLRSGFVLGFTPLSALSRSA